LTKTSQTLSKTFGRCHVTVLFRWTGILLMLSMVSAYSLFHAPVWLVCILYVFRTGFMNSCGALTRSMLMDHVPSHERGKWSSLESVNSFSWSGSAALGGILVRMFGIQPLFVVTALVQFISSLIVLSIFPADSSEGQEEPRRNWTNPRSSSRRDESYRNEL
jgi:predicted MFS family arabinose efflux permease